MSLTLWQSLKEIYREDLSFTLLHCTGIESPLDDETLEAFPVNLEPESMFTSPRKTMLYQYIKHLDPDILIVDTIWFPVFPFLDEIKARKIFLSAYMPPEWFLPHRWDLEGLYAFDPDQFDYVFAIEPGFQFPGSIETPPVINVRESLLQSPDIIHRVLDVPEGKKLALVSHNGEEGEIEGILKNANIDPEEYCLRSLSSFDDKSQELFPLAHYMSGVDLAIGGCGYGFFYETRFHEIPSIYIPQPRIGNEQHWRLENNRNYSGPYDGADKISRMIQELF